ncbi:MAG: AEC family transporter [Parasporobacterium sp.]|nr:AEC family transporter [Parasporobacterium sp.]
MQELLKLIFNLFLMLAAGFLVRKLHIINDAGEKAVTDLVMIVVLPCNVFYSFLSQNIDSMAEDCLWILGISVAVQVIAFLYTRIVFRVKIADHRCNLSYAMLSPNTGFIGCPVAEGVFGSSGLMLACIYLIPQRLIMWSVGLSMYTGVSDKKTAVKKLLTHPCVIACLLGLFFLLLRIRVPDWMLLPVASIGRCNTALAMIVIGMLISRVRIRSLANRTVILFSVHRLLIIPLIIMLFYILKKVFFWTSFGHGLLK